MKTTCCAEDCDENPAWNKILSARHESLRRHKTRSFEQLHRHRRWPLKCASKCRGWEKKDPQRNSKNEAWKSGAKSPTTHESQCLPLPTKKLDLLIGYRHVAAHVSYLGTCSRPRHDGRSASPGFPMH